MSRHPRVPSSRSNRTLPRPRRNRMLRAERLERRILLAVVTAELPPANSHAALPTTDVAATYDENLVAGSASTDSFAVHPTQRGRLIGSAATVSVEGPTVTLDPTTDFFPGELVKVTATSAIQGVTPGASRTWSFRAGVTSGSGVFADSGQTGLGNTYKNRVGDLDGDGDLDAYVLDTTGTNRIMLNDGNGVFTTSQTLGNFASYDVRLGDLDSDGDLDAFATGELYLNDRVWLNDGTGNFSAGQVLADHATLSVDLGDLDGDGDLDAYIGTREVNRVLLNDGNGNFTDSGQDIGNTPSRKVAIGDVDSDGDLDLVSGNPDNPDRIWLNNGSAVFTDSGQMLGSFNSRGIELGDLDGDGDLDLVIAHRLAGNEILLNDGGVFTDSGQRLGDHDTWGIALGDIDADGDLDAIGGNDGQGNQIWLNDGLGVFSASDQSLGTSATRSFAIADLDGDGDLDAFTGNLGGSRIWINENLTPSVSLTVNATDIAEDGGVATFTATLSAATTQTVTLDLGISGTATTPDDFVLSATQIVIPAGATTGEMSITSVDDTLDEPDETIIVEVTAVTNAQEAGTQEATIQITDDDEPPVPDVVLTVDNASIPEAAGVATFTMSLSQPTTVPVTVTVGLSGSAGPGDYISPATEVVFAPGTTTASISVTAVQDELSEPDETVVVDILTVEGGNEAGVQQQTTTIVDDDAPPSFAVSSLTPTESGFVIEFNNPLDASQINLYDTQLANAGGPDVVLTGASTGAIAGSLVPGNSSIEFIKSGEALLADMYTVTLTSGESSFKDTAGMLLDGDGDGTPGDDYTGTFTVAAPPIAPRQIQIPDFVRGPGQDVNVPANATSGIPITISDGSNVRAVDLRVAYDPELLEITGATAPAGGTVVLNTTTTPGVAILVYFSTTPLPAGPGTFIELQARVPATNAAATYGREQVLDVHDVTVGDGNDNVFPSLADDAFHFAAYFSDVSGNGRVNASDAAQVARYAALIDSGFAASLMADPILVGDISGNGRINAADASRVAQFAALIEVPEIPPIPAGVAINGVTPRVEREPSQPETQSRSGSRTELGIDGSPDDNWRIQQAIQVMFADEDLPAHALDIPALEEALDQLLSPGRDF